METELIKIKTIPWTKALRDEEVQPLPMEIKKDFSYK